MQAYGEALAAVPYVFLVDGEPADVARMASRFLALTVNQNGGSLEGVDMALRLWCDRLGRRPAVSHDQVHDLLRSVEPSIRGLEKWFHQVYGTLWLMLLGAHRSRNFTVLEIDENQRVYQGRGSKAFLSPKEFRRRSRTLAGKATTALKPGRSYSSTVGHEYLVMSETVYPAGLTMALATSIRDPVSYDKATAVSDLLDLREKMGRFPDFAMLDAGFCTYAILARLEKFSRRAKNLGKKDCRYWMPAIKSKNAKADLDLDELSDDALNGVYDVIMREWNNQPKRVQGTGLYFAVVPRIIKDSGGWTTNLVIFYRIRKSSWDRQPKELDFEKDVRISAFFTNDDVNEQNVEEKNQIYRLRWNAENLYQKLGKTLGIIPSKDLYKRVLSYGLGLASLAVYSYHRVREWEDNRAGSAEDEDAELTRQRAFFSVARRDLEAMLS